MFWIRLGGQDGVVVVWMEAENHGAGGGFFYTQALGADGHASIGADFEGGAHAPYVIPPRAVGSRAQGGAFFLFGLIPGALGCLAQFTMDFVGVMVRSQGVDVGIGRLDFQDFFTGEIGREASLPELVFAFDFALGLRRGSVAQTNIVEFKGPPHLGQCVGIMGEKKAVIINVELEGPAVIPEGGGQEVEVGEQQFALVKFGASEQATAIIEHVEHGTGELGMGKPAVRRGVQLPEFTNAVALPTTYRRENSFGRDRMGQMVGQGPAADLSAVEFEVVQAQGFGSHKAVGAWRLAV